MPLRAAESAVVRRIEIEGDRLTAAFSLGGRDRRVHYTLGGIEPENPVDALAVLLVPVAMSRGWPIELPGVPGPMLTEGIARAQDILAAWFPEWRVAEIAAADGHSAEKRESPTGESACFFSGGVDSFYSAIRNRDDLSALVFVHGLDLLPEEEERRGKTASSLQDAASELGLELIEVHTDLKLLTRRYCSWGPQAHGAAMASIGHLLGGRFSRFLIPATHSLQDLDPWGSHPHLDPCWSSERVEFVHDSPLPRTEKVTALAASDTAMRHLRVCYQKGIDQPNCGRCEKCLRTMIPLQLEGALERCATFPDRVPARAVARIPIKDENTAAFTRENLARAEEVGDDELARALRSALRCGPARARVQARRERLARIARRRGRRLRRRVRRARRRLR